MGCVDAVNYHSLGHALRPSAVHITQIAKGVTEDRLSDIILMFRVTIVLLCL